MELAREEDRAGEVRESGSVSQADVDRGANVAGEADVAREAAVDARAALESLARPRLVGTEGAARVTDWVRDSLTALGYSVHDHEFHFNAWPRRFALTVVGGAVAAGSAAAAWLLGRGHPIHALAALALVLLASAMVGLLTLPLAERLPLGRTVGVNLLAVRGEDPPHYLVLAHRDSKSQPLPLAVRGPAMLLALLAWGVLVALAVLALFYDVPRQAVAAAAATAVLAGLVLLCSWVGNSSPGALDNASGLAALLSIAAREQDAGDVAFLITDAEELGLAGARAIAGRLPTVVGAINLDGLDDHGRFHLVERFGWRRRQGEAPHLAAALLGAAQQLGLDAARRDVPFGIMLDHVPLVRGGTPALSILRGSRKSLRRVHRPSDDLQHLRGDGVAAAADLVARALAELRAREPDESAASL